MKTTRQTLAHFVLAGTLVVAGVSALAQPAPSPGLQRATAVYSMTNDPLGNSVVLFETGTDGKLSQTVTIATGGLGTGSGLGSEGSVVLSSDNKWLLAVNAGSNDVSVFLTVPHGLVLRGHYPSGGQRPVSVTMNGDLVYVLNAGTPNTIVGFRMAADGSLAQIPGSNRPLSGANVGPAQVGFSPDGDILVVTEKATNQITTFAVGEDGLATGPNVFASAGQTPFGFDWGKRGRIFVSEAFGGASNASALSSYDTRWDGKIDVISASVATHQTAACWTVVTKDGRFAYTTNAGSSSVSGYAVRRDGSISLLDPSGVSGQTGANTNPIDASASLDGRILFVLTARTPTIASFRIAVDGTLTNLGSVSLPSAYAGLASR